VPHPDNRGVAELFGEALPRLVDASLADLILSTDTVLTNAVRRVVKEVEQAQGSYAAHSSSPSP
jgi:FXSXX-COOH protein